MMLRADHIAGGVFVAVGLLIFAVSGDLPFGTLAFPGAGFMPLILASLLILMGAILAAFGSASACLRELDWSDLRHAGAVVAIAVVAVALYTRLGFAIVVPLMLFVLLVVVERRSIVPAAVYSAALAAATYGLFHLLRAQLPLSPLGF